MWTLLWGAAIAAATVLVGAAGADIPEEFWTDKPGWPLAAVVFLAFAALKPTVEEYFLHSSLDEEQRVLIALKAAYVQIVEATGVDWKQVGLHAFVVKRTFPRLWEEQQVRVARWRVVSTPTVTGIRWREGTGLIGRCWKLRQIVGADLVADWGEEQMMPDEWRELDDELRYGLTFAEYERLQGYGAIVASPILSAKGKYVGCISVDAPGDCYDVLWDDPVKEALHDAGLWAKEAIRKLSRV